ncbi:MAG: hypothetical protein PHY12_12305 [Eubacteriales bacterium]|nr:hypothetical protein [Eubacteriales bacterium]
MEDFDTVDVTQTESAPDDAAQAPETQQDDDGATALSELLASSAEQTEETPAEQQDEPDEREDAPENKGLKGRILAAEKKGEKRAQARITELETAQAQWQKEKSEYEQRLSKYQEMELQQEAAALAKEENISEKLALRLLRAEKGVKAPETPAQPRDASGRFARTETTQEAQSAPDVSDRAAQLMEQAKLIRKMGGPDVLQIFQQNDEVKNRVASGEWDFADVANHYADHQRAPAPVRTANAGRVQGIDMEHVTDEELDKINDYLKHGGRIDMRR